MAEVLTQSQIDALLNSMTQGGSLEEDNREDENIEKKYKKYDFYSPKKFTKDRLKMLNSVYENYARIGSSRINGLLRVNSEIEIATVEEQRYYEFGNALNDNDVLTIIDCKIPGDNKEELPMLMHVSPALMLSMIDRLLGGTGDDISEVSSTYTYTDIELSLYRTLIEHMVKIMKDGWSNYMDLDFGISRMETSPGLMQDISKDETIVIIVLDVSIKDVKGKFNICFPGTLLGNIFALFDKRKSSGKGLAHDERAPEEIFSSVKSSPLEITAELGETEVLLSDVYNLQVGDVINLNKPKDSEIYLYIDDKPWFKGKLGVQNKNMAVKISEICENNNFTEGAKVKL